MLRWQQLVKSLFSTKQNTHAHQTTRSIHSHLTHYVTDAIAILSSKIPSVYNSQRRLTITKHVCVRCRLANQRCHHNLLVVMANLIRLLVIQILIRSVYQILISVTSFPRVLSGEFSAERSILCAVEYCTYLIVHVAINNVLVVPASVQMSIMYQLMCT